MTRAATFALGLGMLLAVGRAHAQDDAGPIRCDDVPLRGPDTTFPADQARQVSIDAPLRVVYQPENYFEPGGVGGDITQMITVRRCPAVSGCDLFSCRDGGEFVEGRVQTLNNELVFLPSAGWDADATYAALARGRDVDREFAFCTGSSRDEAPPELGSIDQITSDLIEPRCDAPDGGYRIGVFFSPATDTGPGGSLEYLLFQTRGVGIDGPVLRNRVRNFSTTGQITMAFVLPPEEATSPICVRVAAVDGVGNVDLSDVPPDGQELCADPVQGNFFYGLCRAAPPGRTSGTRGVVFVLAAMGLITLLLVVRRR